MPDAKQPEKKVRETVITELEPGRFKVQRGRFIVTFTVSNDFKLTLHDGTASAEIKAYRFVGTDPVVLNNLASCMKAAAGYVSGLKAKAAKKEAA